MILKEIIDRTTKFFKEKNIESARLESEMLISSALGMKRIELYLKFEKPLDDSELEKCRDFVRRRAQGEPVAYILGQKDFFNLTFDVDSRVLIPRPETETLVETVLAWLKNHELEECQVLDMGAGSGCIGLTIAKNHPEAQVTLMEASEGAVEVAQKNSLKFETKESVEIIQTRIQDHDFGSVSFDVIAANPPYIAKDDSEVEASVKKFEPHSALYAQDQGLQEIKEWSKKTVSHLKTPGLMIFEIGMTQGAQAKQVFEDLNAFQNVKIIKDLSGLDRFVIGEKISSEEPHHG